MFDLSLPVLASWTIAAIFAAAGIVNLAAIASARKVYARWDIPAAFYRTLGLMQLLAAAFLVQPDWRFWGVTLAAPITFGAVVMLLQHRHYIYALGVIVILAGFVPAILAIPSSRDFVHYAV